MTGPKLKKDTDPRQAQGGGISGPGGPWDRDAVVIAMDKTVLLDGVTVAMVEPYSNGIPRPPAVALQLDGRINKTETRANITYLFDSDGAAAIITELLALYGRHGHEHREALMVDVEERLKKMGMEGVW